MATYASYTQKQKDDIALVEIRYRRLLARFSRVFRDESYEDLDDFITTIVDPLITSLDVGQVIPNSSNLAGSQDLTKANFVAIQKVIRDLRVALNTGRAVLTKAIGINVD